LNKVAVSQLKGNEGCSSVCPRRRAIVGSSFGEEDHVASPVLKPPLAYFSGFGSNSCIVCLVFYPSSPDISFTSRSFLASESTSHQSKDFCWL